MSSIIISTDLLSVGQMIAERTAQALGYAHLGRQILSSVAEKHQVREDKLVAALDEDASFWGLASKNRDLYLAYIQAATLDQFLGDNVVCEGLAAHLYIRDVSHILMIRILSDPKVRANQIAAQQDIPPKRARQLLERQEKRRRRWSLRAFGLAEADPSLYDMVISLSQIEADKAVDILTDTVGYRKFQPMTYSRQCLQDKALASQVRATLVPRFPGVKVQSRDRIVVVQTRTFKRNKRQKAEAIKALAQQIPGVEYVEVHSNKDFLRQGKDSTD